MTVPSGNIKPYADMKSGDKRNLLTIQFKTLDSRRNNLYILGLITCLFFLCTPPQTLLLLSHYKSDLSWLRVVWL